MSQYFDRLLETFYRSWFRFHPELAVEVGIQGYADQLTPVEDSDTGALISLEQKMLSSLDEVEDASLDPDRRLDRDLLQASLSLSLYERDQRDWRYRDPLRFLAVEAIEQLMARPVEHFREGLLARLEQIPNYLRAARSFLLVEPVEVPAFWVDLAIGGAVSGAAYLRGLPEHAKVRQQMARPEHLRAPIEAAGRALVDFRQFLERDLRSRATADAGCGPEHFERLLRQRHFLDWDADAIHGLGGALRGRAIAALAETAVPRAEAYSSLADWRSGLEAARERTHRLGIVSVPAGPSPRVVEMPSFLQALRPLPDYRPPVPGDAAQEGWLYLGLDGSGIAPERSEVEAACSGLGWPGRHLQALRANAHRASASLPRQVAASSTSYLGWGEYCEGLLVDLGGGDDPASRRVHARNRRLAALRLELDVELHTRGLSAEAAIGRLVEEAGLGRERARAEVAWISRSPTVALGQAFGGELLRAFGEQQAKEGASPRGFHDRVLQYGPIPLPLLVRRVGGHEAWRMVSERLRAFD